MNVPPKPLIIPIFIPHEGCPHHCVFCNQKTIAGTQQTSSDPAICAIIERFLTYKRPIRSRVEVAFYGGNFLGLPEEKIILFLNQTKMFVDAGFVHGIRFSTRPDTIDENHLNLIAPFPVSTIELGAQSMDDHVLNLSCRGHCAQDTLAAVARLQQKNYAVGLQMMVGLPGDTMAKSLETSRKIIALRPNFVRIYPTLVLAGTPLALLYQTGRYTPLSLDACVTLLKNLYLRFQSARIPVIRMGLQASQELSDKTVVLAGPYHPALGHWVMSSVLLDRAIAALEENPPSTDAVVLLVHPKSYSRIQGLHKQNMATITARFSLKSLKIQTDPSLKMDEVRVYA